MKKKLFSLFLFLIFSWCNLAYAVHEKYYIKELKGDENFVYNELAKQFNKYIDENESDYSCAAKNFPKAYTIPTTIVDCQYRKSTKYMKRHKIDYSQKMLDAEYEFYQDVRSRAVLLVNSIIEYGSKAASDDIRTWQNYRNSEHVKKNFYLRDIWKKYASTQQENVNRLIREEQNKVETQNSKQNYMKNYWWVVIIVGLGTFYLYSRTVPKTNKKLVKKTQLTGFKKNLINFWQGKISYGYSYWVCLTIIGTIISVPAFFVFEDKFIDSASSQLIIISLLYFVALIVGKIYLVVGTWRSAEFYKKQKTKKKESLIWGYLGQVFIVLSIVRTFVDSVKHL